MKTDLIAEIVVFTLSVSLIWFGYFNLFKRYTVDVFRQKMFELRDALFDEAASGTVAFDHPAYTILRYTMNGFLRFGHRISLFELIVHHALTRKEQAAYSKYSFNHRWREAAGPLPEEAH